MLSGVKTRIHLTGDNDYFFKPLVMLRHKCITLKPYLKSLPGIALTDDAVDLEWHKVDNWCISCEKEISFRRTNNLLF